MAMETTGLESELYLNDSQMLEQSQLLTLKAMRQHASPELLERVWKAGFPDPIPDRVVIADDLEGNVNDLDGHDLAAVELDHTDTDHTTCLNVPTIGLVVAGDAVYNDVHLYLAESNTKSRLEWISARQNCRLTRAQLSPHISLITLIILRSSRRQGNTYAISIG